jgi:hypothetical protein
MYKQPLNEDSMEAILQLTEVAIEQKKKKGKTNKNEISKEKKEEAFQGDWSRGQSHKKDCKKGEGRRVDQ